MKFGIFEEIDRLIEYISIENDTSIFDAKLQKGSTTVLSNGFILGIRKSIIQKKKKSSWNCKPPHYYESRKKIRRNPKP